MGLVLSCIYKSVVCTLLHMTSSVILLRSALNTLLSVQMDRQTTGSTQVLGLILFCSFCFCTLRYPKYIS